MADDADAAEPAVGQNTHLRLDLPERYQSHVGPDHRGGLGVFGRADLMDVPAGDRPMEFGALMVATP